MTSEAKVRVALTEWFRLQVLVLRLRETPQAVTPESGERPAATLTSESGARTLRCHDTLTSLLLQERP